MRTVLPFAVLLSLAACQPGDSVGPQPESYFAVKDSSVTHPRITLAEGGDAHARARRLSREGVLSAMKAVSAAVHGSDDWKAADRELRAFIEDVHPDPAVQSRRETVVGSSFPPGHLLNDAPLTPARQEAIAYHAALVIENRDVQRTAMLGPALDRLVGYWPEAKLAEAREIVAAAQRRVEARRTTTA